jgi:hypothetical protein
MGTQPSLRIGDRERDATAAELQEHFAHGRLTLEEFNERLDAVFEARTQSDLTRITADLPHVRSGGTPLPSSRSGRTPRPSGGLPASGWHDPHGALATQAGSPSVRTGWSGSPWAASPWTGSADPTWTGADWSGRGRAGGGRPRGGFTTLATLLAALASWLLVYDVLLVGLHWPWAGRVGLLVAIFTLIRGLLRRIFRLPGARRRR